VRQFCLKTANLSRNDNTISGNLADEWRSILLINTTSSNIITKILLQHHLDIDEACKTLQKHEIKLKKSSNSTSYYHAGTVSQSYQTILFDTKCQMAILACKCS
jgi:hypothetical protein